MSFLRKNLQNRQEKLLDPILARTRQLAYFPESGSRYKTEKSLTRQNRYLVEGNSKLFIVGKATGCMLNR
ncbi:MAG TPA: hypothetical protein VK014_15310 [Cyclobacteriaceae bacterium]|nr:hypothetical protein [Cyclobacteriaceae bacterium]